MKSYNAREAYQNTSVAERYEKVRFSSFMGKFVDYLEKKTVINILKQHSNDIETILDLPCGTGRITKVLIESGFKVVDADISRDMINVSKKGIEVGKINSVVCDAEALPFRDNSFDCIVSIRFTGHVPPQLRVGILNEMRRVTKKWIVISYYNPYSVKGFLRGIMTMIRGNKGAWYPITPSNLKEELKRANLSLIDVKPILGTIAETYMVLLSR
ncbi:MAG: hypothetical protein B6U72_05850 [Candidatus Altiarchaeales archaeon ex4484_2]|nr:MAG: hypothetical protein B6U72_05850 [Candidatus Altiarchaeales archaeon ex4484_2]